MKLGLFGKMIWFVVAYSPLFFSIILKFQLSLKLSVCDIIINTFLYCIPLFVCILILKFRIIDYAKDTVPRKEYCEVVESNNSEYVLFVVTYLIPFYNINFTVEDIIPTIFMLIIIAFLYIKSPLFAVNPVLKLLKYNLYKAVRYNEDKNIVLISKDKLANKKYYIGLINLSEDTCINTTLIEGDEHE